MTVILVLSDCPTKLRGDMTKWMVEINTGVYVGNFSARVRDALWDRVIENLGSGRATMVFNAQNEQHMDFRVYNSHWQPIDFDGIKLMLRPAFGLNNKQKHMSQASKMLMYARKKRQIVPSECNKYLCNTYIVLDLETTGLDESKDSIIEMGALYVDNGIIVEEFQLFVHNEKPVSASITALTGITDSDLKNQGVELSEALDKLLNFIEQYPVIGYNISFENKFLEHAMQSCGYNKIRNHMIDVLEMARLCIDKDSVSNFQMKNIADILSVPVTVSHRAISDCHTTYGIYVKLKEFMNKI